MATNWTDLLAQLLFGVRYVYQWGVELTERDSLDFLIPLTAVDNAITGRTEIDILPSALAPHVYTNDVVWVDGVFGTASGPAADMATPYATITQGMAAAVALLPTLSNPVVVMVHPGIYTEAPLTIPAFVTLQSVGGASATIIQASAAAGVLITGTGDAWLKGFTLQGANAAGTGIRLTTAGIFWVDDVDIYDCETGVNVDGATATINMAYTNIERRDAGETVTIGILATNGGLFIGDNISVVGVPGVAVVTNGLQSIGSGSFVNMHKFFLLACTTGAQVTTGAKIKMLDGDIVTSTTAMHIAATSGILAVNSVQMQSSATWDLLVEHATAVVMSSGIAIDGSKVSITSGASWVGSWVNTQESDAGMTIEGELHVGSHLRPAETAMGGGDSHTLGMAAQTNTNLEVGAWNDLTAILASASGSVADLFPALIVGSTFYIGGDEPFPGLKIDATIATVLGGGDIETEYWNGAAWVAFQSMTTAADASYDSYGDELVPDAISLQMRFGLMPSWATKALDGTTKYWVRFKVTVGAITTSPRAEQCKLHTNRTEVNADGFVEHFGNGRPVVVYDLDLEAWAGAVTPGSQDIAYGTNLIIGHDKNSFPNAQTKNLGRGWSVPLNIDTSLPMTLEIEWHPSTTNAGDMTWNIYSLAHADGDVLAHALAGPLTETLSTETAAASGVAYQGALSEHDINIPTVEGKSNYTLAMMIERKGGVDTFTGAAVVRSIRLRATAWRQ